MKSPDEPGYPGDSNGAVPPFGVPAPPGGTTAPFGVTTAPFGATAAPFGTTAPFALSPFSADGQFNASGGPVFTDPRAIIKKAILIIRSRWVTGLLVGLLAAAAVGAVLFRFRPIEATAETTMIAESPLDQILNPSGVQQGDGEKQESQLTNHLSVMTSRAFRQRLADSFTPEEKLAIQGPYLKRGQQPTPAILMTVLAKKITVDREADKDFFTIDVRHISPDVAQMIANRFTTTYLALVQSQVHAANEAADSILTKQAAALTSEISAIEDQRREFRKEHNLISAEENQTILEDRIKTINLARADLRVQRAKLEAEVAQAREDLAKSPLPFSNTVLSAYGGTSLLRQQLDSLQLQRDVLAIKYGPKHAKMLEVQGSIDATEAALTRNFRQAFEDLESQLSLAINSERGLNSEFDAAFNESLELSRSADRLNTLAQAADNKRKTLDDLMQRIGRARIDTGLPADVLRVIDAAYLKHSLIPMIAIYAAAIGLFGLLAFVSAPIFINFFDERINGNIDVEGRLRVDVLGVVPRLSRTRKEDRPHVVRDSANLAYAEAFMTLASQVDLLSKKPNPRRLLVTSTLPGEGKSTLASNLATAYTRLGRRTVLVDCDFRRPSQRTMHKVGGTSGLLPWARAGFQIGPGLLEPGGPVDATVLPDGTVLIPAGASDPQPARYLIAEGMARFFALLRQEFEVVIIDTPPAGVFQDALILARHCDDTVFVAREGKANTSQITRILQDFAKTAAPAVGIVLNDFSTNASHPHLGHRQLYQKYAYYSTPARAVAGTKR